MAVSERVKGLRTQSLETPPSLSAERARLLTDFYRRSRRLESTPMTRARAFEYLLEIRTLDRRPQAPRFGWCPQQACSA